MREPNPEKLNELVGKLLNDLGVSLAGASILLGDRLGLYKAMADGKAVTPSDLAKKTRLQSDGYGHGLFREGISRSTGRQQVRRSREKRLGRCFSHRCAGTSAESFAIFNGDAFAGPGGRLGRKFHRFLGNGIDAGPGLPCRLA